MSFFDKILGDPNERELKRLRPIVERINTFEDEMRRLSDEDLRAMTGEFKQELSNGADLDDILPEAFAVVREAAQRAIGMRPFDVQLVGGIVLHEGKVAEMRTGEGKTLVATLPAYLNALPGHGVHIVTVNDYLAQRDRDWMGRIYEFLGLSVGVVTTAQQPQSPERRAAYMADITYGINNELGFDYLRDNMVSDQQLCVQRELNYAIVDEVDNILIDEARTPLIISGLAEESTELYKRFAAAVPRLREDDDYTIDAKTRTAALTDAGIDKIEHMLGVENIYNDMNLTRHLENALKAQALFQRDRDYIVRDGEVLIVDEFTGRVLAGRRYSEGLHQAIEAKENVPIQRENRTLATITFQNYFRLYKKLAGMTGTALTEAEEFNKIYKLDVIVIPTNVPIRRVDHSDYIYRSQQGKYAAVVEEIKERHARGQPVLVGTTSVEVSEFISEMLEREHIPHNVLNAKQHAREALVIAQAGRSGAVTIATNMAGRGTDIKLGGNPEGFVEEILLERDIDPEFATQEDREEALDEARRRCEADRERVVEAGGLCIIGTERHESRRIDNQLRGRSGRQGDPGESRFFVSLEDDLMRRFGTDRAGRMMERLGMTDDAPLENKMVSGLLEQAQAKVEGYNFDLRKHLVEYDDVIAAQREVIYADRRAVLQHENMRDRVLQMIDHEVRRIVERHTAANLPEDWDLEGLEKTFQRWGLRLPDDAFPEYINKLKRETLINLYIEAAHALYQQKENAVVNAAEEHGAPEPGGTYMRQFERAVVLQVVDAMWQDHVDQMEVMRSGIGLRGVAQRDPLVEFKREAYEAFDRLKPEIEHHIADLLFMAPVQIQLPAPPEQALPEALSTNADEIAAASGQAKSANGATGHPAPRELAQAGRTPVMNGARSNRNNAGKSGGKHGKPGNQAASMRTPELAATAAGVGTSRPTKIGRNDPCYCGSGKKYKMCHGR